MSIQHTVASIKRLIKKLKDLQAKYRGNPLISSEIDKLENDLRKLEAYLHNLDQLKPDYNTNEINAYINAISLHMDILKGEVDKHEFDNKDYATIQHGIRMIKTMLKFHPNKYSYLAFITSWFMEWLYFI